jgi:pimeloyl-ACP methyl ester carboxylesterase
MRQLLQLPWRPTVSPAGASGPGADVSAPGPASRVARGSAGTAAAARPLHVERWGRDGPVIVLIHGLGASGRFWRRTVQALGGSVRVIAPDLLGFGQSPWPPIGYSIDDHLDALDDALGREVLRHGPIVLGGHSSGATLALAWAGRHPSYLRGLALIGLPVFASAEEARAHIARLGFLAHAAVMRPRLGAALCSMMCRTRPFWRLVAPILGRNFPPEVARDWVLHTWTSYSRSLEHGIVRADVRALAGAVVRRGTPVRLIHGEEDREAPIRAVFELARLHGWPLHVIPTGSHFLPIERPAACASILRDLLADLPVTGSNPMLRTDQDDDRALPRAGRDTLPVKHPRRAISSA